MITKWLYPAGIASLVVGMALVYAAVITRGVFIPGALLILAGMIACAAGMIVDVARHPHE